MSFTITKFYMHAVSSAILAVFSRGAVIRNLSVNRWVLGPGYSSLHSWRKTPSGHVAQQHFQITDIVARYLRDSCASCTLFCHLHDSLSL